MFHSRTLVSRMESEVQYWDKFEDMRKYIPFLENLISRLEKKKNASNVPRETQLSKIKSLRALLDTSKRMKFEYLAKCEQVLMQLYSKVEMTDILPTSIKLNVPENALLSETIQQTDADASDSVGSTPMVDLKTADSVLEFNTLLLVSMPVSKQDSIMPTVAQISPALITSPSTAQITSESCSETISVPPSIDTHPGSLQEPITTKLVEPTPVSELCTDLLDKCRPKLMSVSKKPPIMSISVPASTNAQIFQSDMTTNNINPAEQATSQTPSFYMEKSHDDVALDENTNASISDADESKYLFERRTPRQTSTDLNPSDSLKTSRTESTLFQSRSSKRSPRRRRSRSSSPSMNGERKSCREFYRQGSNSSSKSKMKEKSKSDALGNIDIKLRENKKTLNKLNSSILNTTMKCDEKDVDIEQLRKVHQQIVEDMKHTCANEDISKYILKSCKNIKNNDIGEGEICNEVEVVETINKNLVIEIENERQLFNSNSEKDSILVVPGKDISGEKTKYNMPEIKLSLISDKAGDSEQDGNKEMNSQSGIISSTDETKSNENKETPSQTGLISSTNETKSNENKETPSQTGLISSTNETKSIENKETPSQTGLISSTNETKSNENKETPSQTGLISSTNETKSNENKEIPSQTGLISSTNETKSNENKETPSQTGLISSTNETKSNENKETPSQTGLLSSTNETVYNKNVLKQNDTERQEVKFQASRILDRLLLKPGLNEATLKNVDALKSMLSKDNNTLGKKESNKDLRKQEDTLISKQPLLVGEFSKEKTVGTVGSISETDILQALDNEIKGEDFSLTGLAAIPSISKPKKYIISETLANQDGDKKQRISSEKHKEKVGSSLDIAGEKTKKDMATIKLSLIISNKASDSEQDDNKETPGQASLISRTNETTSFENIETPSQTSLMSSTNGTVSSENVLKQNYTKKQEVKFQASQYLDRLLFEPGSNEDTSSNLDPLKDMITNESTTLGNQETSKDLRKQDTLNSEQPLLVGEYSKEKIVGTTGIISETDILQALDNDIKGENLGLTGFATIPSLLKPKKNIISETLLNQYGDKKRRISLEKYKEKVRISLSLSQPNILSPSQSNQIQEQSLLSPSSANYEEHLKLISRVLTAKEYERFHSIISATINDNINDTNLSLRLKQKEDPTSFLQDFEAETGQKSSNIGNAFHEDFAAPVIIPSDPVNEGSKNKLSLVSQNISRAVSYSSVGQDVDMRISFPNQVNRAFQPTPFSPPHVRLASPNIEAMNKPLSIPHFPTLQPNLIFGKHTPRHSMRDVSEHVDRHLPSEKFTKSVIPKAIAIMNKCKVSYPMSANYKENNSKPLLGFTNVISPSTLITASEPKQIWDQDVMIRSALSRVTNVSSLKDQDLRQAGDIYHGPYGMAYRSYDQSTTAYNVDSRNSLYPSFETDNLGPEIHCTHLSELEPSAIPSLMDFNSCNMGYGNRPRFDYNHATNSGRSLFQDINDESSALRERSVGRNVAKCCSATPKSDFVSRRSVGHTLDSRSKDGSIASFDPRRRDKSVGRIFDPRSRGKDVGRTRDKSVGHTFNLRSRESLIRKFDSRNADLNSKSRDISVELSWDPKTREKSIERSPIGRQVSSGTKNNLYPRIRETNLDSNIDDPHVGSSIDSKYASENCEFSNSRDPQRSRLEKFEEKSNFTESEKNKKFTSKESNKNWTEIDIDRAIIPKYSSSKQSPGCRSPRKLLEHGSNRDRAKDYRLDKKSDTRCDSYYSRSSKRKATGLIYTNDNVARCLLGQSYVVRNYKIPKIKRNSVNEDTKSINADDDMTENTLTDKNVGDNDTELLEALVPSYVEEEQKEKVMGEVNKDVDNSEKYVDTLELSVKKYEKLDVSGKVINKKTNILDSKVYPKVQDITLNDNPVPTKSTAEQSVKDDEKTQQAETSGRVENDDTEKESFPTTVCLEQPDDEDIDADVALEVSELESRLSSAYSGSQHPGIGSTNADNISRTSVEFDIYTSLTISNAEKQQMIDEVKKDAVDKPFQNIGTSPTKKIVPVALPFNDCISAPLNFDNVIDKTNQVDVVDLPDSTNESEQGGAVMKNEGLKSSKMINDENESGRPSVTGPSTVNVETQSNNSNEKLSSDHQAIDIVSSILSLLKDKTKIMQILSLFDDNETEKIKKKLSKLAEIESDDEDSKKYAENKNTVKSEEFVESEGALPAGKQSVMKKKKTMKPFTKLVSKKTMIKVKKKVVEKQKAVVKRITRSKPKAVNPLTLSTESPGTGKKRKDELQKLQDIRGMFIAKEVLSLTGIRNCRIPKMMNVEELPAPESPQVDKTKKQKNVTTKKKKAHLKVSVLPETQGSIPCVVIEKANIVPPLEEMNQSEFLKPVREVKVLLTEAKKVSKVDEEADPLTASETPSIIKVKKKPGPKAKGLVKSITEEVLTENETISKANVEVEKHTETQIGGENFEIETATHNVITDKPLVSDAIFPTKIKPGPKSKKISTLKSLIDQNAGDRHDELKSKMNDLIGTTTISENAESVKDNSLDSEDEPLSYFVSIKSTDNAHSKALTKKKKKTAWSLGIIKRKNKKLSNISKKTKLDETVEVVANVSESKIDHKYFTDEHYCFSKYIINYACKTCSYVGLNIVDHYKMNHVDNEVPIARLSPTSAVVAVNQSLSIDFDSSYIQEINLKRQCRFCYKTLTTSLNLFFNHIVKEHTGEYNSDAQKSTPSVIRAAIPPSEDNSLLLGYICGRCNYTQLSIENLKAHVANRHNDEETVVHTINMNAIASEQDIEKRLTRRSLRFKKQQPLSASVTPESLLKPTDYNQLSTRNIADGPPFQVDSNKEVPDCDRPSIDFPYPSDLVVRNIKRDHSEEWQENDAAPDEQAPSKRIAKSCAFAMISEHTEGSPEVSPADLMQPECIKKGTNTDQVQILIEYSNSEPIQVDSNKEVPDSDRPSIDFPLDLVVRNIKRDRSEEWQENDAAPDEQAPSKRIAKSCAFAMISEHTEGSPEVSPADLVQPECIKKGTNTDQAQILIEYSNSEPFQVDSNKEVPDSDRPSIDFPYPSDLVVRNIKRDRSEEWQENDAAPDEQAPSKRIAKSCTFAMISEHTEGSPEVSPADLMQPECIKKGTNTDQAQILIEYSNSEPNPEPIDTGFILEKTANGSNRYRCAVRQCYFKTFSCAAFRRHINAAHSKQSWSGYCSLCKSYPPSAEPRQLVLVDALNHFVRDHHSEDIPQTLGVACPTSDTQASLIMKPVSQVSISATTEATSLQRRPYITAKPLSHHVLQPDPEQPPNLCNLPNTPQPDEPGKPSFLQLRIENVVSLKTAESKKSLVPDIAKGVQSSSPTDKREPGNVLIHYSPNINSANINTNVLISQGTVFISKASKVLNEDRSSKLAKLPQDSPNSRADSATKGSAFSEPFTSLLHNAEKDSISKIISVIAQSKQPIVLQRMLTNVKILHLYKCGDFYCSYTTSAAYAFTAHLAEHWKKRAVSCVGTTGETRCVYCSYENMSVKDLVRHVLEEHGHCTHGCAYCWYMATAGSLVELHHTKTHHQSRQMVLKLKPVTNYSHKELMKRMRPRNEVILPYFCKQNNLCKYKCYTSAVFISHLELHRGDASFKCSYCRCTFVRIVYLMRHLREHGLCLYQCPYCLHGADTEIEMLNHMVEYHPNQKTVAHLRYVVKKVSANTELSKYKTLPLVNLDKTEVEVLDNIEHTLEEDPIKEVENSNILRLFQPEPCAESSTKETAEPYSSQTEDSAKYISAESTATVQSRKIDILSMGSVAKETTKKCDINTIAQVTVEVEDVQKYVEKDKETAVPVESEKPAQDDIICLDSDDDDVVISNLHNENTKKSTDSASKNEEKLLTRLSNEIGNDTINQNNEVITLIGDEENVQGATTAAASQSPLQCAKCSLSIKQVHNFKIHITKCYVKHKSSIRCKQCQASATDADDLINHMRVHHGGRIFLCDLCGYKGWGFKHIKDHMWRVHKVQGIDLDRVEVCTDEKDTNIVVKLKELASRPGPKRKMNVSKVPAQAKKICFGPEDIDKLPVNPILDEIIYCSKCKFGTKVRSNMLQHLQLHASETAVPSVAPVNPVPHLETNEKHFDKMANLALSSKMGGDKSTSEEKQETRKMTNPSFYPKYIPDNKRYVCGALGCQYISLNEITFKHHWVTLHMEVTGYKCVHCPSNQQLDTSRPLTAARVVAHLKMHDMKMFTCSECKYYHHQKHLVERHLIDKHGKVPNASVCVIREAKENVLLEKMAPVEQSLQKVQPTMDLKPWRCKICKYKMLLRSDIIMKYRKWCCPFCAYKALNVPRFQQTSPKQLPADTAIEKLVNSVIVHQSVIIEKSKETDPKQPVEKLRAIASGSVTQTNLSEINDEPSNTSMEEEYILSDSAPNLPLSETLNKNSLQGSTANDDPNQRLSIEDLEKQYGPFGAPQGQTYACPKCEYRTHVAKDMEEHLLTKFEALFWSCSICRATHQTYPEAQRHNAEQHRNAGSSQHEAPVKQHVDLVHAADAEVDHEQHRVCSLALNKTSSDADPSTVDELIIKPSKQDMVPTQIPPTPPEKKLMNQCPLCEFSTKHKPSLVNHILHHLNIKPFMCPYCDFHNSSWKVKAHVIKDHPDKQVTTIQNVMPDVLLATVHLKRGRLDAILRMPSLEIYSKKIDYEVTHVVENDSSKINY